MVWTEPYEFYAGGGLGITCAAPARRRAGGVRGVFTVDFSLDRLAGRLEDLQVSPRGRVFVATGQGAVLIGRRGSGASRAEVIDAELAAATVARRLRRRPRRRSSSTTTARRTWAARCPSPSAICGGWSRSWSRERDYTEHVDAEARAGARARGAGAAPSRSSAASAWRGWIARPLRELAQLARRIRHGDLDVTVVPRSRDEIGVLARRHGRHGAGAAGPRLHPRDVRPLRQPRAGRALPARSRGAAARRRGARGRDAHVRPARLLRALRAARRRRR